MMLVSVWLGCRQVCVLFFLLMVSGGRALAKENSCASARQTERGWGGVSSAEGGKPCVPAGPSGVLPGGLVTAAMEEGEETRGERNAGRCGTVKNRSQQQQEQG
jgi:hypothetical protein